MTLCTAEEVLAEAVSSSSDQGVAEGDAEAGWRHSMTEVPPYVAVVQDRHEALRVAHLLSTRYRECTFGADTEVRRRRADWLTVDTCSFRGIAVCQSSGCGGQIANLSPSISSTMI